MPVSGSLLRSELYFDSPHRPMPTIDWGWERTYRTPAMRAITPATGTISARVLALPPTRKAPVTPRTASPSAAMTPEMASCHDATTGLAPQRRVSRYVNAVEKTWPAGSVSAMAVLP